MYDDKIFVKSVDLVSMCISLAKLSLIMNAVLCFLDFINPYS